MAQQTEQTTAQQTVIDDERGEDAGKSRWQRLRQWLKARVWHVHPALTVQLTLSPTQCYSVLERMTKPSVQRLHLRNYFSQGRRYHLRPAEAGDFRMTTTSKVSWHPRRRTSHSAVLAGTFEDTPHETTRLTLRSHIRLWYLLRSLFMPTFMLSMLVFMPWHWGIIVACTVALYALSWLGYRYDAKLEAHEMVYFIKKSLEKYVPQPSQALPPQGADVVYDSQRDFAAEWERFYEQMQTRDDVTSSQEDSDLS